MTVGESQRPSFFCAKVSACCKCTTSIQYFCAVADFSKGHIEMLISAPRDENEWNCKTSSRPAFRDGPPFLAIQCWVFGDAWKLNL